MTRFHYCTNNIPAASVVSPGSCSSYKQREPPLGAATQKEKAAAKEDDVEKKLNSKRQTGNQRMSNV